MASRVHWQFNMLLSHCVPTLILHIIILIRVYVNVLDLAYIPFHHDTNKRFMHIFTSMCICACIACVCVCACACVCVCVCAKGTLTIFINLF